MVIFVNSEKSNLCFKWKDRSNNKEFIAHNDIVRESGFSYRFVITFRHPGQSVEIIS